MAVPVAQVNKFSWEDLAYYGEITHPVHMTLAEQDDVVDNPEAQRVFDAFTTPKDKKELKSFDAFHCLLSDDGHLEEVVGNQIKWL